jgi:hypothetical protein
MLSVTPADVPRLSPTYVGRLQGGVVSDLEGAEHMGAFRTALASTSAGGARVPGQAVPRRPPRTPWQQGTVRSRRRIGSIEKAPLPGLFP